MPFLTMTPSDVKTVVANLDDFIEVPHGVERLRKAVLTMAVSGQLVPQDPTEVLEAKVKQEIDNVPFPIPPSWSWVKIPDVAVNLGQKIPDNDFYYIDVSAIDSKKGEIINPKVLNPKEAPSRARKIVKEGSVLYSSVRPYLLNTAVVHTNLFDKEIIASTAFFVLHPNAGVSSDYLHIVLRSPFFDALVNEASVGAAYPAINDRKFARMPVPLPPLREQERIVSRVNEIMDQLDDLEGQQMERDEVRARLVRSAMQALGRGEKALAFQIMPELVKTPADVEELERAILTLAVTSKLVAQSDKDKVPAFVSADDADVNPLISPDDLPDLPKSWALKSLDSFCEFQYGYTAKAQERGDVRYVRITDMSADGKLLPEEPRFVNLNDDSRKFLLNKGDVLTARIGATYGRTIVYPDDGPAIFASYLIRIKFDKKIMLPEYYLVFARSSMYWKQARSAVIGSAQPQFNANIIRRMLIPIPPLAEQQRIVKKVSMLRELVAELKITTI